MKDKVSIQYIRETKNTKEKLVYVSVTDYTSAKWAEMENGARIDFWAKYKKIKKLKI